MKYIYNFLILFTLLFLPLSSSASLEDVLGIWNSYNDKESVDVINNSTVELDASDHFESFGGRKYTYIRGQCDISVDKILVDDRGGEEVNLCSGNIDRLSTARLGANDDSSETKVILKDGYNAGSAVVHIQTLDTSSGRGRTYAFLLNISVDDSDSQYIEEADEEDEISQDSENNTSVVINQGFDDNFFISYQQYVSDAENQALGNYLLGINSSTDSDSSGEEGEEVVLDVINENILSPEEFYNDLYVYGYDPSVNNTYGEDLATTSSNDDERIISLMMTIIDLLNQLINNQQQ